MNPPRCLLLILTLTLSATLSHAMDAEEERLRGFAQHQSNLKRFDEAREGGKRAYTEEQEQLYSEKERDLAAYKKDKPKSEPFRDDNSREFRDWEKERKAEAAHYEETRKAYAAQSAKQQALDREAKGLPTLAQEMGLDQERPRFDFKKRNFGTSTASSGGSGRGGGGSSSGFNPGNSSFPPPPTFDDFSDGYVPAPNVSPEDFGDVPPPPPPPMGFDQGFSNGSEFIPPPPPPPGNFESGDF
ncbi:hypothetical protein [Bdellovibrio sp. HCB209]|uniref:hypothetical protein n=1 Tax=Bdellovibrio sp. HCB209 TaxID=3394354 RepID=UPI0039B531DB